MSINQVERNINDKSRQLVSAEQKITKLETKRAKKGLTISESSSLVRELSKRAKLVKNISDLNKNKLKEEAKIRKKQEQINKIPRNQNTYINNSVSTGDIINSNVAINGDLIIESNSCLDELKKVVDSINSDDKEVLELKEMINKFIGDNDLSSDGKSNFKEEITQFSNAVASNIVATMICTTVIGLL